MWDDIITIFSTHIGFYAAKRIAFYNLPKLSPGLIDEIKNRVNPIKSRLQIYALNYNMMRIERGMPGLYYLN
jgi:hypothetical protein